MKRIIALFALAFAASAIAQTPLPPTFYTPFAQSASIPNPVTAPLLSTRASLWTAYTPYNLGEVVANGGNYYVCELPGTSALSGGPSGQGAKRIVDGTVSWYYLNYVNLNTSGTAPTITTLATGNGNPGLTNVIKVTGGAMPPQISAYGGTPVFNTFTNCDSTDACITNATWTVQSAATATWTTSSPVITLAARNNKIQVGQAVSGPGIPGGDYISSFTTSSPYTVTLGINPTSGTGGTVTFAAFSSSVDVGWSFWSDAPLLQLDGSTIAGAGTQIFIDGQKVTAGSIYVPFNTTTSNGNIVINWNGVSRPHQYLWMQTLQALGAEYRPYFTDVRIGPTYNIWTPAPKPIACFMADSNWAGSAAANNYFPFEAAETVPELIGLQLGWETRNYAIGSTGYLVTGNAGAGNFQFHVSDISQSFCNVVLISGGGNDTASYTNAQIGAAAATLVSTVRASLPNAPIIVLGVVPTCMSGAKVALETGAGGIGPSIAALDDANDFFIPLSAALSGPVINGTGNTQNPLGDGNCDNYVSSDGVHPVNAGLYYLATWEADAIRAILPQTK